MPENLGFGGYMDMGVVRPETKSRAFKLYQYILQTPVLGALSLLCKGLPTYSNND
jgi:hypothetical protein